VLVWLTVPTGAFGISGQLGTCPCCFGHWKVHFGWLLLWFILVVSLLVCLGSFLVSSCFSDSGCRVATLLNPFAGPLLEDLLLALSLTSTQTLVSCSSSSSPEHLQREVLCDYPVVKGVGYQAVKGVHAGMWSSTLSTKAHTTKKTSFYISTSCGFGLTD